MPFAEPMESRPQVALLIKHLAPGPPAQHVFRELLSNISSAREAEEDNFKIVEVESCQHILYGVAVFLSVFLDQLIQLFDHLTYFDHKQLGR